MWARPPRLARRVRAARPRLRRDRLLCPASAGLRGGLRLAALPPSLCRAPPRASSLRVCLRPARRPRHGADAAARRPPAAAHPLPLRTVSGERPRRPDGGGALPGLRCDALPAAAGRAARREERRGVVPPAAGSAAAAGGRAPLARRGAAGSVGGDRREGRHLLAARRRPRPPHCAARCRGGRRRRRRAPPAPRGLAAASPPPSAHAGSLRGSSAALRTEAGQTR
mmetsp:Transcript_29048/g.88002  ORF Transcript_29048/g.88002 Transcript_29048/m.88002 type:complete len:225 (+) Transcript_29048:1877-2551(+)